MLQPRKRAVYLIVHNLFTVGTHNLLHIYAEPLDMVILIWEMRYNGFVENHRDINIQ